MNWNSLLIKLASQLQFSDWVDEHERQVVENAWEEWKHGFFKQNRERAAIQRKVGDIKLFRLLTDTTDFLRYEGDQRYIKQLQAFRDYWRQQGEENIANALQVRIDEASYDEPEVVEEVEIADEDVWDYEEEEAPVTLRSLVAKTLRYTRVFAKMARG